MVCKVIACVSTWQAHCVIFIKAFHVLHLLHRNVAYALHDVTFDVFHGANYKNDGSNKNDRTLFAA